MTNTLNSTYQKNFSGFTNAVSKIFYSGNSVSKDEVAKLISDPFTFFSDANYDRIWGKPQPNKIIKEEILQHLLYCIATADLPFAHEFIQPLVAMGANVNSADMYGRTVMHSVARVDTALALIENDAKIHVMSIGAEWGGINNLPVHTVNPAVRRLYMDMGESPQQLDSAGRNAHFYAHSEEDIANMVKAGGIITQKDNENNEPIHFAGSVQIMKDFCVRGASLSARNSNGDTPLHNYSRRPNLSLITAALEDKADPNAVNKAGETPVTIYGIKDIETMRLFKAAGGNYNHQDKNGNTMLHEVERYPNYTRYTELKAKLLEVGADQTVRNIYGCLPGEYASAQVVQAARQARQFTAQT